MLKNKVFEKINNFQKDKNTHKQTYCVFFLIFITFIAYSNVYKNPFIWDDENYLLRNSNILSIKTLPKIFTTPTGPDIGSTNNFYRPIQLLFYSLIYFAFGFNIFYYHLFNVLVHIFNALLIFFLLKKISDNVHFSFIVACLWALLPIHTEAITYINGTADPLSVFFALVSFHLFILYKQHKKIQHLFFSSLSFVLALLSKEIIIILPALFLIYLFIFSEKNERKYIKQYHHTLPFFIISILYFVMRLTFLNFTNTLNFFNQQNVYTTSLYYRILTFIATLPTYFSFIYWPKGLHMEREFFVQTSINLSIILTVVFVLILLFFSFYFIFKSNNIPLKIFSFGILWFFTCMIPMSGIVPVNALILEHWLYLSSVGIVLSTVSIFQILLNFLESKNTFKKYIYPKTTLLVFIVVVFLLLFTTYNQNKVWKDPITFYSNILKYEKGTARVYNNLAMAYADSGNLFKAEEYYLTSIKISDTYPQPHYNLATLYLNLGRREDAIYHLKRSIEINPNFYLSYPLLINLLTVKGDFERVNYYGSLSNTLSK